MGGEEKKPGELHEPLLVPGRQRRWHGLSIQPAASTGKEAAAEGEVLVGMTESCMMAAHAVRGGADAVPTPSMRIGQAI